MLKKANIFAKQTYYDSGPKSQKLLALLLKKQSTKARVLKIKVRNAEFVIKSTEIANAFLKNYQQLYTQDINPGRIQKFIENIELAGVTEEMGR